MADDKPQHLTIEEWLLAQNLDHMRELHAQGQRIWKLKQVTLVVLVVVFALVIALMWQVQRRNQRLDELERTTRRIEAIASQFQQDAQQGTNPAVAEGLAKIDRICTQLDC